MNYGNILRRAWEITWRHKVLWIFGIAVALFGGTAGGGGGNGGNVLQYAFSNADIDRFQRAFPGVRDLGGVGPAILAAVAIAIGLGVLFAIVGIIVRYTAEGGLIAGADEADRTAETDFRTNMRRGWRRLLYLLAIDLLLGLAMAVLIFPIVVVLILGLGLVIGPAIGIGSAGDSGIALAVVWGILGFLVWLAILIASMVILGGAYTLLREFAIRFAVLEQRNVFQSIGDAWRLLRHNLGRAVLMWLILTLIALVVGFVLLPVVLVAFGVAAGLAAAVYAIFESVIPVILVAVPALLVAIALAVAFSGVYYTYMSTAWTLAFRALRPAAEPLAPAATEAPVAPAI